MISREHIFPIPDPASRDRALARLHRIERDRVGIDRLRIDHRQWRFLTPRPDGAAV